MTRQPYKQRDWVATGWWDLRLGRGASSLPGHLSPAACNFIRVNHFFTVSSAFWKTFFKEVSCLSQLVVKRVGGGSLQKETKRKRGEMKVVMDNCVCGVLLRTVLQHGCKQSGWQLWENASGMAQTHRHMPNVVLLLIIYFCREV